MFSDSGTQPALMDFPRFRTSDPDEAHDRVAEVFCDHRLKIFGRNQKVDAEMYYRPIRGIAVGRMRYGANVSIDPGRLETFALIQMPLHGVEVVEHGGQQIDCPAGVASVLSPMPSLSMRHWTGTEKLFVRIDRDVLERHCRQHLGTELKHPLEFQPRMPLFEPQCAPWNRLMRWLYDEAGHDGSAGSASASPLFAAQVEQIVIATLLLTQPHNYADRLAGDCRAAAPCFVKRAEEFMEACAHEPLTIGEIAEHAGVSARSLFAGFRNHRSSSPMSFLKSRRMQRAREELLHASPSTASVTSVAMRWGFTHLGHFAVDYKRRFGESPSSTLRR